MPEADIPISMAHALLLGILQGVTEFLPVSSSAHLIIVSSFMDGKPLPLVLNIALHVGTFGALLVYFWRDWLRITKAAILRVTKKQRSFEADSLLPGLIVGTIPAAILGLLWEDDIERLFHNPVSVIAPLALVGVALWWVDKYRPGPRALGSISLKDAFIIGVGQACALVPGVSRSGATIIAGRLRGLAREDAARYSFLLGTPAMAGAAILKSKDILAHATDPTFIVGVSASFVTGCLSIGLLLRFLRKFGFASFAVYRVALAAVLLAVAFR
jgi:undecaprenyl-diphosphatase